MSGGLNHDDISANDETPRKKNMTIDYDDSIEDELASEVTIEEDAENSLNSFDDDVNSMVSDELREDYDSGEMDDSDTSSEMSQEEDDNHSSYSVSQKGGDVPSIAVQEYDDAMFQKFSKDINREFILQHHPECVFVNDDEVGKLYQVTRNKNGIIIDPLHTTIPILTKYERARIIGQRAKQIESGCTPYIALPEKVISGLVIAEMELAQKKIPFVIKRPIPNGTFEYWKIDDLEIIDL
jgi:DNA-directed RNA polymerase subunit K/omega